jgi:hypothetical protein
LPIVKFTSGTAETPEGPWIPQGMKRLQHMHHRLEPIGYEELKDMMDAAGVRRAMICPPTWEGDRNDLGIEASRRDPDRFGVMAHPAAAGGRSQAMDPRLQGRARR